MAHLLKAAARRTLLVYNNFDVVILIHRNRKNQVLSLVLQNIAFNFFQGVINIALVENTIKDSTNMGHAL